MYFYRFRVWYYDEDENEVTSAGITVGANFNEALNKVKGWYGEDNVSDVRIGYLRNVCGPLEEVLEEEDLVGILEKIGEH